MQVFCGTCQLSFDAPEGASGLVCPICRGPLAPKSADKPGEKAGNGSGAKPVIEWNGGDLDDLIALLSAPAISARVEVLPAAGGAPAGEVHLLAGGVSDALVGGKSVDDALDRLRAVKAAKFRIEQRLPNPADGDLTFPGPESGTLDGRALAHLMRYCEDYVITCSIEVWRGNENARVEYKRGEISGVTVGGIDAPERLAEVMQWSSGNYRLLVPTMNLPAVAPKRAKPAGPAAAAPVPAPAPSAQAARQASSAATKTIFGMPAAEVMKARAAAEAARPSSPSVIVAPTATPAPAQPAAPARTGTPAPTPVQPAPPAARAAPPPGVAANYVTPPVSTHRASATKTMFGVPAPELPSGFIPGRPGDATAPVEKASESDSAAARAEAERKTGARKVAVPAPDIAPPIVQPAAPAAAGSDVDDPTATRSGYQPAPAPGAEKDRKRPVATAEPLAKPAPAPATRAPRQTPVLTYIGVGVTFGLALVGIWQLVALLGH